MVARSGDSKVVPDEQEVLIGSEEISRVANTYNDEKNKDNDQVEHANSDNTLGNKVIDFEVRNDWRNTDMSTTNTLSEGTAGTELYSDKTTTTQREGFTKVIGSNSICKKLGNINMGDKKGRPMLRNKLLNNPFDIGIKKIKKETKQEDGFQQKNYEYGTTNPNGINF